MKLHFWIKKQNQNLKRNRLRLFTIAWGEGGRPLADSKKYYKHFLTVALNTKTFTYFKQPYDPDYTVGFLFLELHYRK